MRVVNLFFVAIALFSGSVYAKSASDVAAEYYGVLKTKNYEEAASYFDQAALSEFRNMMSFITELPDQKVEGVLAVFFGEGATKDTVSKLPDSKFFSSFLSAMMSRAEAAGGLNFDGMEILGEIKEGEDISHVVTRNKVTVGDITLEAMEVVSFRKIDGEWKALMSGKLKGMATQMRAALSQAN